MGRVLTNATGLRAIPETAVGVLPSSFRKWDVVEFDNITAYGANITTTPRRPISQDRGRRKGLVTDLESTVDFETDITIDALLLFAEGFMFAEYSNVEFALRETYGTPSIARAPRVDGTADEFDIDAASATLAGKVQFGAGFGTLLFSKGYAFAANNGLHILDVDLVATNIAIGVTSNLVDETSPPDNAILEVAGIRTDDFTLTIDAGLATGTLVSAADIDPTTLGLTVGQYFELGSPDTSTANSPLQNAPTIAATTVFGKARITALTSTTITFDKADPNLALGGAGSSSGTETIDFMYGRFLRNVPVTANATDNRYLERSWQFEASYPGLAGPGIPDFEYAIGNFSNEIVANLGLTDKATATFGFIGTNSDLITATRKAVEQGAASAVVAAGGSGYTVNDTLTVSGGTGTSATFNVDSEAAGVVTAVSLVSAGRYTAVPANPASTTGGTGTLCTLTVTYTEIADPGFTPLRTAGFSTSANLASITTDVVSSVSDVCFKSLTVTLLNNVSAEKCLGTLGATFMNAGLFQADLEGQMLFTSRDIVNSIRSNTTVTFAFALRNEDGQAVFDIPAMTLGGGGREFPVDQSVLVNITGASFTSNAFGFDLGISLFSAVPGVLPEAA